MARTIYDITEADEIGWPLHPLNGREHDHYAGGKPDECPACRPVEEREAAE